LRVALALAALAYPLRAMTEQDRRAHLEWMLKSLPNAPQFNAWQQRTGELPPDFDAFPRNNFLPDPFTFMNGRAVRNASDWTARRTEIRWRLQPGRGWLRRQTRVERDRLHVRSHHQYSRHSGILRDGT
jgi:hypothetical protein